MDSMTVQVEIMTSSHHSKKIDCAISDTCILINNIPTVRNAKSQLQSYLWTLGHYGTFDIIMNKSMSSMHPFTYAIIVYSDRSKNLLVVDQINSKPFFFDSHLRPSLIRDKKKIELKMEIMVKNFVFKF
jgi:hypothetical protein